MDRTLIEEYRIICNSSFGEGNTSAEFEQISLNALILLLPLMGFDPAADRHSTATLL